MFAQVVHALSREVAIEDARYTAGSGLTNIAARWSGLVFSPLTDLPPFHGGFVMPFIYEDQGNCFCQFFVGIGMIPSQCVERCKCSYEYLFAVLLQDILGIGWIATTAASPGTISVFPERFIKVRDHLISQMRPGSKDEGRFRRVRHAIKPVFPVRVRNRTLRYFTITLASFALVLPELRFGGARDWLNMILGFYWKLLWRGFIRVRGAK